MRELGRGGNDRLAGGGAGELEGERLVDLEHIDRMILQELERTVPRAEVDERNLDAERLQHLERAEHATTSV